MINYEKLGLKLILQDNTTYTQFTQQHFTHRVAKYIYQTITAYFNKFGKIPTTDILVAAISNQLPSDKAEIYGGYLKSLDKIDIGSVTVDEILAGLSDKSLIDTVDKSIEELTKAAYNRDNDSVKRLINQLHGSLLLDGKAPKDIKTFTHEKESIKFIDSFVDSMRVNGVRFSGLSIIGAPTSGGKSIFSLQQALYSFKQGYNVTVVSLEVPAHEMLARLYSCEQQVEFAEALIDSDSVNAWKDEFFDTPNFFHILAESVTDTELINLINTEGNLGCDLLVIDYLQLVESEQPIEEWKAISKLVRKLHLLAIANSMAIISPVQINVDEIDDNGDSIRVRTRGSRELENSASLFLCIYSTKAEQDDEVARLFTIKARNGIRKTYLLETHFNYMSFADSGIQL